MSFERYTIIYYIEAYSYFLNSTLFTMVAGGASASELGLGGYREDGVSSLDFKRKRWFCVLFEIFIKGLNNLYIFKVCSTQI